MNAAAQINTDHQSDFRFGRRVHCILYGGRNGTIFAVHGEPDLGNSKPVHGNIGHIVSGPEAHVDIVWDDGTICHRAPESIMRGVQWRFLDEPDATQEDVNDALVFAQQEQERWEAEEKARRVAFDNEVEALRHGDDFSYMEQIDPEGGYCDKTKLAAKNIRKLLKKTFPGTKFSVRKESHGSLWVSWRREDEHDALNQMLVRKELERFDTSYFDHYSDCSRSSDSPFNVVFGGVRHITAQADL